MTLYRRSTGGYAPPVGIATGTKKGRSEERPFDRLSRMGALLGPETATELVDLTG